MKTTINRHPSLSRLSRQTKLFTAIAAGSCAVFLVGCRDRDRDIVRADATAEQSESAAYTSPTATTPAATTPATSSSSESDAQSSSASMAASSTQTPSAPGGATVADSNPTEITLQEENLNVAKREVDAGGVLVSKEVVTEEVEQPIELQRERVEVTQLSAEEARERGEAGEQQIDEDQIYIPLTREVAVAQKEVTTSGAVQIEKEQETEQQIVSDTVRREVVDVERQGDAEQSAEQQSSGYAATSTQESSASGADMQQSDNQDLEQRIRERLRSEESLALSDSQIEDIDISVEQDTVKLSGNVPDQQIAQQIEQRVREVDGVQMVQNELQTETSPQAAE